MPFSPNSSPACALHADRSCPKKLSSEYQLYACGNFFGHSSILEKIAILGQSPRAGYFHGVFQVWTPSCARASAGPLSTLAECSPEI